MILQEIPGIDTHLAGEDGHIYSRVHPRKRGLVRLKGYRREAEDAITYPIVCIRIDGRRRWIRVHQLICDAFHGLAPSSKHVVRHLDGSQTNNRPSNLAWGTQTENMADMEAHGRRSRGESRPLAKLTEAGVRGLRKRYGKPGWDAKAEAETFGCTVGAIYLAVSRETWKHVS